MKRFIALLATVATMLVSVGCYHPPNLMQSGPVLLVSGPVTTADTLSTTKTNAGTMTVHSIAKSPAAAELELRLAELNARGRISEADAKAFMALLAARYGLVTGGYVPQSVWGRVPPCTPPHC